MSHHGNKKKTSSIKSNKFRLKKNNGKFLTIIIFKKKI